MKEADFLKKNSVTKNYIYNFHYNSNMFSKGYLIKNQ